MSQTIHEEARRPDVVTQQLKKGFEWTTQHSMIVMVVVGGVLLVMAGIFGARAYSHHQEQTLQAELYNIEREYVKKKDGFDTWARMKDHPSTATLKPEEKGVQPSGNIDQDYGTILTGMKDFATKHPKTAAGAMAGLYASDVYTEYGKLPEATEVLKSISYDSGLVGALVHNRLATLLADQKDCAQAIAVWTKQLSNASAAFLHPEIKLRMAMCSESTGDVAGAERLYKEVVDQNKDSARARLAEQFLRHMRINKN